MSYGLIATLSFLAGVICGIAVIAICVSSDERDEYMEEEKEGLKND